MSVDDAAANPPETQIDLAGRRDVNDLAQAYRASGDEARKQKDRADRAEAALVQQSYAANPRQDIPQRNPYKELEDLGLADPVRSVIQQEIQSAFRPITQGIQARGELLATYGADYGKFEADVASYVQGDPALNDRYQRMWASDPAGAMEFAFLKFGESQRRRNPNGNGPPETIGREQQAQAAVPGVRVGESRNPNNDAGDRVSAAFEAYQKNPNRYTAEAYAKARFRTVVRDEHLGI